MTTLRRRVVPREPDEIKEKTKLSTKNGAPKTKDHTQSQPKSPGKDKQSLSSSYRSLVVYAVVAFILYTLAPLYPTLWRLADTLVRGENRAYPSRDLFRYGLYYDMVKDPNKAVFPELLPTDLQPSHAVFLEEYEDFRTKNSLPYFQDLDDRAVKTDPQLKWKVLYLQLYGQKTCVAKYFPRTMKIIENSSLYVQTVMFSRIDAGHSIKNHIGPNKGVIRLLMGLKVPEPSEEYDPPHLKVWDCMHYPGYGDVENPPCPEYTHEWTKAGQEFAFDDSFGHRGGNPTNEERIALFLDLARHDLKGWRERLINYIVLQVIRWRADEGRPIILEGTRQFCERAGLEA